MGQPESRRVGSQAVIYGAGQLLSRLVSFLLLPLYTRMLTPSDYGIVAMVGMVFEIVMLMAANRIDAAVYRQYYQQPHDSDRRTLLSTAFLLVNLSYASLGLIVLVWADNLSSWVIESTDGATLVRIAACAFMFQGSLIIPMAAYKLEEKPWHYLKTALGVQIFQALLNILFLVFLHLGVRSIFLGTLISYSLWGTIVGASLLIRIGRGFSRKAGRELLRFAFPLVSTSAAVLIMTTGGRYALQHFGTLADVGLFALAVTFGIVLVNIGNAPLMQAWEVARFRLADRVDRDTLYSRAFVILNISLFVVGTAIAMFVGDYVSIAASPSYAPVIRLVPFTLVAYLLQSWTMILDTGALLKGNTSVIARSNWFAAMVSLLGYVTLVPRWSTYGAAATLLMAFGTRFFMVYMNSQRINPIRYRWLPIAHLAIGATVWILLSTLWDIAKPLCVLVFDYIPQRWDWDTSGLLAETLRGILMRCIQWGAVEHTNGLPWGQLHALLFHGIVYLGFIIWLWRSSILTEADKNYARSALATLSKRSWLQVPR